jgi:REP element-mobilizing transposase RayT
MPDHIHVFVACEDSGKLSSWVKALKGTLSSLFRRRRLVAPFWQEGFFDHLLRSNESYDEKWLYVARNPVRAKLVAHEDDWPFGGEIHSLD